MGAMERLAFVDSLRALAAVAVVFHHIGDVLFDDVVTRLGFDFGRYGVLLFFIISGYVVPHSLLARTSRPLISFALSRGFRLYPAYWFSLAVVALLGYSKFDSIQLAANITMAQRFLGVADIIGVYWTLAVELAFYLACVALFVLKILGRLKRMLAFLAVLSIATLVGAVARAEFGWPIPFGWLGFLGLMFGGAVLKQIDDDGHGADWRIWPAIVVFLAMHLAALSVIYIDPVHERPAFREVLSWVAAVASFLVFRRLQLAPPGTPYIGRISYSLYLLHGPVSSLAISLFPPLVAAPAAFAACLVAAATAYHLIEQPAIRFGRQLIAARGRNSNNS